MKKRYLIYFGLFLVLTACEKEPETNENEWVPYVPWKPDYESFTHLVKPLLISKGEFLKKTANTYYHDNSYYVCSDSLGKVVFWNVDGEPFGLESLPDSFFVSPEVVHPGQQNLHKFKKDCSSVYRRRMPGHELADTGYYVETEKGRIHCKERFAYKGYWCYDEADGTFALSWHTFTLDDAKKTMFDWNEINAGQLMALTEKYMIVRFYPAIIQAWEKTPKASHLYTLAVFQAIKDEEYALKRWYTDAFDADVEIGGYEWETQVDSSTVH